MAPSIVYFFSDTSRLREGALKLFRVIARDFSKGKVGLKVHFGEGDNKTHVKAEWLLDAKEIFTEPVFVECNVLYRGHRTLREDHVKEAIAHGFGFLPVDILDGEKGEAEIVIPVNIGNTKNARLGAGIAAYERLIAISHFKGHMATGFGGALKNIGMGLGSRAGKMEMHSIVSPVVKADKCVACGTCVKECPVDAITLGRAASIDSGKCIGCAHCIAVCPASAIDLKWNMGREVNRKLMERIAEYAYAVTKERRLWYMNFVTGLTYDCDCFNIDQKPFMKDIGILLSQDPVAIDQASLDLVKEKDGGVDPFSRKHGIDGAHILEYAEKIGLGTRGYVLKKI